MWWCTLSVLLLLSCCVASQIILSYCLCCKLAHLFIRYINTFAQFCIVRLTLCQTHFTWGCKLARFTRCCCGQWMCVWYITSWSSHHQSNLLSQSTLRLTIPCSFPEHHQHHHHNHHVSFINRPFFRREAKAKLRERKRELSITIKTYWTFSIGLQCYYLICFVCLMRRLIELH